MLMQKLQFDIEWFDYCLHVHSLASRRWQRVIKLFMFSQDKQNVGGLDIMNGLSKQSQYNFENVHASLFCSHTDAEANITCTLNL